MCLLVNWSEGVHSCKFKQHTESNLSFFPFNTFHHLQWEKSGDIAGDCNSIVTQTESGGEKGYGDV